MCSLRVKNCCSRLISKLPAKCTALCVRLVYKSIHCVYKRIMVTCFESSDTGMAILDRTSSDALDDVGDAVQGWLNEAMNGVGVSDENELSSVKFNKPKKDILCKWLEDVSKALIRQRDLIVDLQDAVGGYKTDLLSSRGAVITLQSELLQCKTEQLQSLQNAVQDTVKDTVKTEIKSYGDAVKKNLQLQSSPVIPRKTLKTVVQNVMQEEDRSRNLLVFGLKEEADEQVKDKIEAVLLELGEKPRIEACRVGRTDASHSTSQACRPVKVTVASPTVVRQILIKAKKLKDSESSSSVFICPDRSPDERVAQRKLVLELKKKSSEQPDRRHYIKGGKVCSTGD